MTCLRGISFFLFVLFLVFSSSAVTYDWNTQVAGSLTYTNGNMVVNITNTNFTINGPQDPNGGANSGYRSPKYVSAATIATWQGGFTNDYGMPGLVLDVDWPNLTSSTTVTITFTVPVTGPVTFQLYDVNSQTTFRDRITISGTNCLGNPISPTITSPCGNPISGNVMQGTTGCTHGQNTITFNSPTVKTILINYASTNTIPDGSSDPTYQYIIISPITAANVMSVTTAPNGGLGCGTTSTALTASSTIPGASFSWTGPAPSTAPAGTTPNSVSTTVSSPGTYTVRATDPVTGCSVTATSIVTQATGPPGVSIAPPGTITCSSPSITLTASSPTPAVSYTWSGGGTGPTKSVSSAGTYTVTARVGGCTSTASVTVSQNTTAPNVSVTPTSGQLNCTVSSIVLTASSTTPGVTYSWNVGGTNSNKTVSNPGTKTVTVTNPANGCTASASATITSSTTQPNVTIAPPGTLSCTTGSVTLTASSTTPGTTFTWSGGGTGPTKVVSAPGTYTVTATGTNTCTRNASVTVSGTPSAVNVSIAPPGTLTCVTTSITLTASSTTPGVTYTWSGGGTGPTKIVSSPGTYTVTATDGGGCTNSASVTVVQSATPPDVSIAPPATLSCAVTSVTLTASSTVPGVSFAWSGGGTGPTKTVTTAGTYTVTATDGSGCSASTSVTVIQNNTPPDVSIATPATITCSNPSVTLTASSATPGVSFTWSGGGSGPTKTVSSGGSYTVTATAGAGCTNTASVTVVENTTPPNVSIAAPSTLTCATSSVTLTASSTTPGVTYTWSGGGTGPTKIVSSPGTYTVTASDGGGCTNTASTTVSQSTTPPDVSIAAPAVLTCATTNVTLTASSTVPGVTFTWSGGGAGPTKIVSAPGSYTVTATDAGGCTNTASTTVTQNAALPDVNIGFPDTITCADPSIVLTASSGTPGVTFAWTGGGTGPTKAVSTGGNYTVTATDGGGCSASATVTVIESTTAPDVSIGAPAPITCANPSVTLSASSSIAGVTFSWTGGGTGPTKTVTSGGTYIVTATDLTGCSNTASVTVIQSSSPPDVSIAAPGTLTCAMPSLTLTASSATPGVTFSWSGGGTGPTKTVGTGGTYTVTATDLGGCTNTASVTVAQNTSVPDVMIGAPAILTCSTTSVTLTASSSVPGISFTWSGGGTGPIKAVTSPGNYTVTATDGGGCTNTASTTVTQNTTPPDVSIGFPDTITCTAPSIILTASSTVAGISYSWTGGGTGATISISTGGIYTVTGTDGGGCSANASVTVIENTAQPDVSIAAPATITCSNPSVVLTASSSISGVNFAWTGGGTGPTKTVSSGGSYTVTASATNGCTNTASATVVESSAPPDVSIAPPGILTCASTSVTLSASSTTPGVTFSWSGGGTGPTKIVTAPGSYTVTATDADGCANSASTTVSQSTSVPDVSIAAPAVLTCGTTSVILTASSSVPGISFTWSGGGTGPTKTVSSPGSYTVTATDPGGCANTATATVDQNITPPDVSIAAPTVLTCSNTNVTLTASSATAAVTFAWSGGGTGPTKIVSSPGSYTVTATDAGGCTASTSTTVSQDISTPNIAIAQPDTLTCTTSSVILTATSSTAGVSFSWTGGPAGPNKTVNAGGSYTATATAPNGCAATATATVIENSNPPDVSIATPAEITCAAANVTLTASSTTLGVTYAWMGGGTGPVKIVSAPGSYTVTVTDAGGCTSTASTTVGQNTVAPMVSIAPPATLTCAVPSVTLSASSTTPGATFSWTGGFPGSTYSATVPGSYTVTATDPSNGCTSSSSETVSIDTVRPAANITGPASICRGESATLTASGGETYIWNAGLGTSAGITVSPVSTTSYSVTVTSNVNGCSSVAGKQVVVLQNSGVVRNISICQGETYFAGGADQSTTGIYYDTLPSANGCDSVITSNLTVMLRSFTTINAAICQGETYFAGGKDQTGAGIYFDTLPAANGCDSIITTNLAVNPVKITELAIEICEGESVTVGSSSFDQTGQYTVLLSTSFGCDSIVNLDLTVHPDNDTNISATICFGDSYIIAGQTFDQTGNYTINTQTVHGCDSTILLQLTELAEITSVVTDTICPGNVVTIGSQSFGQTGVYTVILSAANGCDSTITLNLTVGDSIIESRSDSICAGQSITVGNSTFDTPGIHVILFPASNGCDSVVFMNLTVLPLPSVAAASDRYEVFYGDTVQLMSFPEDPSYTYSWTPAIGLSAPDTSSPSATITATTWFAVTVKDVFGCVGTDSVQVKMIDDCYPDFVYNPNAFSPNGDFVNDCFLVLNSDDLMDFSCTVYNRWNEIVYSSRDQSDCWDGTYKGQPAPLDAYIYQVSFRCHRGEKVIKKGILTLIR